MNTPELTLKPIGQILVKADPAAYTLEILPAFRPGLQGLEAFSHLLLFWWSGGEAHAGDPSNLISHPPYPQAGAQGCFATRSPHRPNPVALSVVRLLDLDLASGLVKIGPVDARDASWLLDIKPYIPANERVQAVRTAAWMADFPQYWEDPHPAKTR